jgi:formate dehydrogenase major subunit
MATAADPKITLDGKTFAFRQGQTVLEVARENGFHIPSLCYHRKTGQCASCRVCVVEVEKMRGLQASCALPASDGMVVKTNSPQITEARKIVVDLMLVNGQHNCMSCERNGSCELQDAAYDLGIETPSYIANDDIEPIDDSAEMVVLDRRKCIKCGRCIAACSNVVVNEVLQWGKRGSNARIICDDDLPMGKSSCVQCGECSQMCPVGAIIDKKSRRKGRTFATDKVDTTCPYCGVGCQITLHVDRQANRVVRITGREVVPNDGMLCVKGRYAYEFHASPKRLTQPLIKKDGKQVPVSWEEALDYTASKIKAIVDRHGPDVFSALGSGRITNENNYAISKFTRAVIKTNNVDHCARTCHAPTVAGLATAFGHGASTNSIEEISEADVLFVIGSNMTEAHPVVSYFVKRAAKNGATLIVSDPRKVDLARWSNLYVQHRVGTDVPYLNGLIHEIFKNGWQNEQFLRECTENPDDIRKWVQDYPVEKASQLCGVPADTMRQVARILGTAKNVSILYTLGITEHTCGTDNVKSIANLQMVLGHIGKRGGGVNPLRGQNNVQGACDMGALPNVYHAYQRVDDPAVAEKMARDWGVSGLSTKVGYMLPTMLHKAPQGGTKVLFCVGDNTVQTEPNMAKTIKEIEALEFFVVVDIFHNITTQYADVVFPDVCFNEDDGTYTNLERRVQRLRKAVNPPGQARPTWWIVQELGKRLGVDLHFTSAEAVWDDLRRTGPSLTGITYPRIDNIGIQWPCPTIDHPGTPILHLDGKFTRGKGLFCHTDYRPQAEPPDAEYPFVLSTGRRLWHYHTGTQTRNSVGMENLFPEELLEISPQDAARLEIKTGDQVRASSRRGSITLKAWVTDRSPAGVCWTSFHFFEACGNVLTIDAYDNVTQTPEYKACAIRVEKVADGQAPEALIARQARP